MIAILVSIVHAYNLGVLKYDYKILYNVAKILIIEVNKCSIVGNIVKNKNKYKKNKKITKFNFMW